jgi:hypothetical protein
MDVIARGIQFVGMYVDAAAVLVRQDEIAFPGIVAELLGESASGQERPQRWDVFMRHGDIQVVVRPRLLLQQRVDGPAAVHVDFDVVLFEVPHQTGDGVQYAVYQ